MSAIEVDRPPDRAGIDGDESGRRGPWPAGLGRAAKRAAKGAAIALGLAVVALPAAMSRLEARLGSREELFLFWGQALALVPGIPGKYVRKCYYCLTLRRFCLSSEVGFLGYFSHRDADVGRRVYVGAGACIGVATVGDGALIGSRVSILSGGQQHRMGPDGRLEHGGLEAYRRVRIGAETWIGEGATIMADVGGSCIVAAGSVVSSPTPSGCLVAGNPARFVRRLLPYGPDAESGGTGR